MRIAVEEIFDECWIPEPNSGCWLWLRAVTGVGYGTVWSREDGKMIGAHRRSYIRRNGPIPDGLFVLHRCDVRCCVNPDHLFLGTNDDNFHDMKVKRRCGRQRHPEAYPIGVQCSHSILSETDVLSIREDLRAAKEIAKEFGVSPQMIQRIKKRLAWRHL